MNRSDVATPKQPAGYIKTIVDEIDKWVKSHMWPLSCYGFTMQGPSLPGLTDIHPDELREEAYQHRLPNGHLNKNYVSKYQNVKNEHLALRERLLMCMERSDVGLKKHLEDFVNAYFKLREAKLVSPKGPATVGSPQSSGGTGFSFSQTYNQMSQPPGQVSKPSLFAVPQTKPAEKPFSFRSQIESNEGTSANKTLFSVKPSSGATPPMAIGSANISDKNQWASSPTVPSAPTASNAPSARRLFDIPSDKSKLQESSEASSLTYTALANLTTQERELFEAEDFPPDSIPLIPPPRELCAVPDR